MGTCAIGCLLAACLAAAACSPTPTHAPPGSPAATPPAAKADDGPLPNWSWRAVDGQPGKAEYGPPEAAGIATICDPAQQLVEFDFIAAPDNSFGPETARLWIDGQAMDVPVQFRSAEDVAKDDPAAWIELPATHALVKRLGQARDILVERGDAARDRFDTGPATPILRRALEGCG